MRVNTFLLYKLTKKGFSIDVHNDYDISFNNLDAYIKQKRRLKLVILTDTGEIYAYKKTTAYYGDAWKRVSVKYRWIKDIVELLVIEAEEIKNEKDS